MVERWRRSNDKDVVAVVHDTRIDISDGDDYAHSINGRDFGGASGDGDGDVAFDGVLDDCCFDDISCNYIHS
ncbi:Hypothetical predicted protein [Octopus vulgaris]|uniref:Uncharacterized protein n=1 Tax=Octopus vulgaris TaxID=6645 RepID=A0AA36FBZ8_OCTVU|nr:Hypothetical predicted protein [Octopus vulgaris]